MKTAVALGLTGCLLLASAGCQSNRPGASLTQLQAQLAGVDPRSDPLAARTPIVDIHTHTFNTRYLPLRGVLLGKRDAFPPITWLLSDHCSRTLAQAIVDRTEVPAAGGMPAIQAPMKGRRMHSTVGVGPVCKIFLGLLNKAAERGAWDDTLTDKAQMRHVEDVADRMNFQERLAVRAATHMMGMEEHLESPNQKAALTGAVRFLWLLTQSDAEMTKFYRLDYGGAPMRGSPLMVSHMMDLGPVYGQIADGDALLDFEKRQIPLMEAHQNQPDSGLIYFVAYNPYRDHWEGGQPGDALRVVRSAIENHHAWGVKVYPPSGYRPAGNDVSRRAGALFTRYPGRQWDARYRGLGRNRNAALDRRLEELLVWCIEKDVPVFVHSGTGEFEARKGYGIHNSNPRYWREFLEDHPEADGSPCRLRLCLGHAGGDDFWFGGSEHADWGREVYDLCREFPNVYCEITTHAELTDPAKQAYFVDHLARLFAEPVDGRVAGHKHPQRFPFSEKLLYGTDWYLPEAAERANVLRATQQAFLHEKLRPHFADYFNRNALRFLNARARLRDTSRPVPPAVRKRLGALLE